MTGAWARFIAPLRQTPAPAPLWSPRCDGGTDDRQRTRRGCAGGRAQHVAPLRLTPYLPQSALGRGRGHAVPVGRVRVYSVRRQVLGAGHGDCSLRCDRSVRGAGAGWDDGTGGARVRWARAGGEGGGCREGGGGPVPAGRRREGRVTRRQRECDRAAVVARGGGARAKGECGRDGRPGLAARQRRWARARAVGKGYGAGPGLARHRRQDCATAACGHRTKPPPSGAAWAPESSH